MGKSDTAIKNYTKRNDIFADLFNAYLYNGKQVIKPESLTDEDSTEIAIPFEGREKGFVQKYRDVLKTAILKEDGKCRYLLLGLEAQKKVHYAMPVRTGLYDMMRYAEQVSRIAAENKKRWKEKKEKAQNDAAWVIETSTDTKLHVQEKKGERINMCQGLIEWEEEARADEREKVTDEVTKKVTSDVTHAVILNMYREDFTIEQIARVMNKSEEEIKEILQQ